MKVTNLIQNIGKCRDLLSKKEFKSILKNIYLFKTVYPEIMRHVDKYIQNNKHELDFTYNDIQELADEILNYIKNYQSKFTFKRFKEEILKNKIINDKVLIEFQKEKCDYMYVDRELREAYKILSYLALSVYLIEEQNIREDFTFQVVDVIRSFI